MRSMLWIIALVFAGPAIAFAQTKERSGEEIVKSQCSKCHATGVNGAPRIDDREAWVPRMKQGLDATVRSAMKGHGGMPARGGMAELSDNELRAAITYMFNPAGIPPKPAAAPAPGPNQKVVEGTEIYLGVTPASGGLYHVNVTLRDAKTHAVIPDAEVEAKVSNPVSGADSKPLKPMTANKVASYGNDFRIGSKEPNVITVQIRRKGNPSLIEAKFDYKN